MRVDVALCVVLSMGLIGFGEARAEEPLFTVDADVDALIRVDSTTGDRTVISGCVDTGCTSLLGTGPSFAFARGIFPEADGKLLISDSDRDTPANNIKTLFRVDPISGDRTIVSSSLAGSEVGAGPPFELVFDVILDANEDILVADIAEDQILRVDPVTGDRTVLSSNTVGTGPEMSFPGDMVLEPDGNILVTEGAFDKIYRVDPVTGDRTVVSSSRTGEEVGTGISLANLGGITLDANGVILAADEGNDAVIAVDRVTGDRTEISGPSVGAGPALIFPVSIDVDSAGIIFIADTELGVVEVDFLTGDRTIRSSPEVGSGIAITEVRDVRVQPNEGAPLPSGSPLTLALVALMMLMSAGFLLARRPSTIL